MTCDSQPVKSFILFSYSTTMCKTKFKHQVATCNLIIIYFKKKNFAFTAEELGLKPSITAYRDPNLKPDDLLTGVTFASGGAGYVPLTTKIAVLNLKSL